MIGRDILANILGRSWAMLMGIAFVPVYLSKLGPEAYGLIGFYATLQAVLIVADFGLSWTVTRELAQARATGAGPQRCGNLIRTLEAAYWVIAITVGGGVALCGDLLAEHWFRAGRLSTAEIAQAIHLIGAVLALQMPSIFYQGTLNGLDRQPLANVLASLSATLRWGGAALVLLFIVPSIQVFFLWQVIAAASSTVLYAHQVWHNAPVRFGQGRFEQQILREVWRFTFAVMASAFAGVLAMQVDKLLLSKLLPLEQFGYYSLAVLITSLLTVLVTPLHTAFFPRLSALHAKGDRAAMRKLYDTSTQLLAVLVVPVALMLVLFPREILHVWTTDEAAARTAAPLVSLLAAGNLLYCFSGMANLLLIAAGWPALSAITLGVMAAGILPAVAVFVPRFGASAAAMAWIAACVFYVLTVIPATHLRLLEGRFLHWLSWSVAVPSALGAAFFLTLRWLLPPAGSPWLAMACIAGTWLLATACIAGAMPSIRQGLAAYSLRPKAA